MIEHFLITRFNLKRIDWTSDRLDKDLLDESWLNKRINLFKTYCLPSVIAQTCKNFIWVIYFEKSSLGQLQPLLKELEKHDFIKSVFVNGYDEFLLNLPEYLNSHASGSTGKLITTRMDNDDSIHENFIKEIQKASARLMHSKTVLHFPYGLCLHLTTPPKLAVDYYPLNQFVSLIELITPGEKLESVYSNDHYSWGPQYSIKEGSVSYLWLQIVHDTNKENVFRGKITSQKKLTGFNISKPAFGKLYLFKVGLHKFRYRLQEFPGKYLIKKLRKRFIK